MKPVSLERSLKIRSVIRQLKQPGGVGQAIAQTFQHVIQRIHQTSQGKKLLTAVRPVLLVTLFTTGSIALVRQAGGLQTWELRAYDQMMRLKPEAATDERLLVVTITDKDLQAVRRWPLTDEIFAQVFAELQRHEPRVIGLDIYRDFPQPPGEAELHQQFQQRNVVAIRQLPSPLDPDGVAPPDIPAEQVGFNDVILDPDGVLRRGLLFTWDDDTGNLEYSFAYRLAERYLAADGIQPIPRTDELYAFDWGETTIRPFSSTDGGYQTVSQAGWQFLLNYRVAEKFVQTVTLSEVLAGELEPSWVKDKVVLIGTTALSNKDFFFTPLTKSRRGGYDMPGVLVHAHMVSQLLDAVSGDRPLIRLWSDGFEFLLLLGCVAIGTAVTWGVRNPLVLFVAIGGIGTLWVGMGWSVFIGSGWLPIVMPGVGLLSGSVAMISYKNYRAQREQRILAERAEEQEQAILSLRLAASRQAFVETPTKLQVSESNGPEVNCPFQRNGIVANRYRIQQVLATGGFGITYVATDTQRPGAPECVVKRLRPSHQDPQFLTVARRLFQAEAEILEILGRHDRIPQLLAYFEEGKDFLLVEQFVPGGPLSSELISDQRWPEAQVITLLKELLPTLSFIHDRRIIHRDIKPNNIIRRPDGALVLIDFGAVKQMQPHAVQPDAAPKPQQTIAIGTHGYAPPEQLAGHPRISSDIYALGVIAIRALTGIPPHMLEQDPDSGDLVWQRFSKGSIRLTQIVKQMTCYHFGDRYRSAAQVLSDLELL